MQPHCDAQQDRMSAKRWQAQPQREQRERHGGSPLRGQKRTDAGVKVYDIVRKRYTVEEQTAMMIHESWWWIFETCDT